MRDNVCQAGVAGEQKTHRAGKRAQDPGRDMREAGEPVPVFEGSVNVGMLVIPGSEGHECFHS